MNRSGKSGVTLIEICLAVLFLSLLFSSAYGIMTYSRRETEKGFWIQQAITQLRNGTRAMTDLIKKTSYPSTILSTVSEEQVVSFKENRSYDKTGRLINLPPQTKKNFDMHTIITSAGSIIPTFSDITLMTFPVCEPERDLTAGYTEGVINWVQLVLRPASHYNSSGLGTLHIIEREETYNTRSDPSRAYGLTNEFTESIPITRSREIIKDVREIEIDRYDVDELRGIFVDSSEQVNEVKTKRILISISVSVSHPKDRKIWLNDQCSIINNVQVVEVAGPTGPRLVKINTPGAGGSAVIKIGGSEQTVGVGAAVGPSYEVKEIFSDSVCILDKDTGSERMLFLPDDS